MELTHFGTVEVVEGKQGSLLHWYIREGTFHWAFKNGFLHIELIPNGGYATGVKFKICEMVKMEDGITIVRTPDRVFKLTKQDQRK